ncbi:MAG: phosphoadenosine phosphosulfate reductase family protein [Gammaproteobacteria bacterium]|nr:phosphoadenosine phosphosulfate reductase family protein [Gammaproteobacteria bacterium]
MSYQLYDDEPYLVSFSGGRSSGYMLHNLVKENNGLPEQAHVLFANTGKEMEETLDFVAECAERWSINIVWLEHCYNDDGVVSFRIVNRDTASMNGEPFEELISRKHMLPNVVMRFCTEELKIKTMFRYMRSVGINKKDLTNVIGIRYDEPRRVAKVKARNEKEKFETIAPLVDAKITKHDVGAFWKSQSFDLKLPNNNGTTPLGNCDLCFLKGEKKISSIIRDYPTLAKWWFDQEDRIQKGSAENGGKTENASFIKRIPYRALPGANMHDLLNIEIECFGCTD